MTKAQKTSRTPAKATKAAKSTTAAKRSNGAKSTSASKTAASTKASKSSSPTKRAASSTKAPAKATSAAKSGTTKTAKATKAPTKARSAKLTPWLASQRDKLIEERDSYLRSASELKAQADSLALEHEPGDVQFDEEGGEGGTSNVDRELDLVLSAQALNAVNEIDWALDKISAGTYGTCERCGQPIPEARLEALPAATLCVACKSGGLSSRR